MLTLNELNELIAGIDKLEPTFTKPVKLEAIVADLAFKEEKASLVVLRCKLKLAAYGEDLDLLCMVIRHLPDEDDLGEPLVLHLDC